MKIRFLSLAWDWGVGEFETVLAPSLLQPNNVPWLLQSGYDVQFTVFTVEREAARLRDTVERAFSPLKGLRGQFIVTVGVIHGTEETAASLKRAAFVTEFRAAVAEEVPVVLTSADVFFADAAIRNIVTYCRKPNIVAAGVHLRVQRDPFLELLRRYRETFGNRPVSNARLVDMCMQTLIGALEASHVDRDVNASATTAVSIRNIRPDLLAVVHHMPTPVMVWPNQSDLEFLFDRIGGREGADNIWLIDNLWPEKLIAEGRWRLLASSDLFFMVELTSSAEERRSHMHPPAGGMLYNEQYGRDRPNFRMHEQILVTLRRQPFLSAV